MSGEIPERLDALNSEDHWPTRWKYHHIYRYRYAKKYCRNKTVLDVGCGYGYGSFILSSVSKKVVGIDISQEAIRVAQKRYSKANIAFFIKDAEQLDFPEKFDVIISFENIEHLQHPDVFFRRTVSLLVPDGMLIISTPNKKYAGDKNPFHVDEYSLNSFNKLLKKYFDGVYIQGQYWVRLGFFCPWNILESKIPRLTLIPCYLGKPFPRESTVLIGVAKRPRHG